VSDGGGLAVDFAKVFSAPGKQRALGRVAEGKKEDKLRGKDEPDV